MKKMFLAASVLLVPFIWASAQKTIYDPNAVVRSAKNFHAVEVSNGIDVYISKGEEALAVSGATAEYSAQIQATVEKGILKIWFKEDKNRIVFNNKRALKAYISYNTLDAIKAAGGSDILVDGTIKGNSLAIHISGGSDFKGKVDVQELLVEQSAGSDISIEGKATNVSINASSGSDFKGYDLVSDNCSVEASSGSDVQITVNKNLAAEANSGSDVFYKGGATLKPNKQLGSSIKKVG
ncbi:MAG TPA: head GIN domain-containing protein [Chitinophagaceae bacterium]|nr:head GIN domain-containing protein [Chitinophagaceae bacterium]